jgi:uncharacterized protein YbaR (Trm112 family)
MLRPKTSALLVVCPKCGELGRLYYSRGNQVSTILSNLITSCSNQVYHFDGAPILTEPEAFSLILSKSSLVRG